MKLGESVFLAGLPENLALPRLPFGSGVIYCASGNINRQYGREYFE